MYGDVFGATSCDCHRLIQGSLRAIADGFSEVLFSSVTVGPSAEIIYRFNLEPLGSGRTLVEQRADRDSAKWRLRAAQSRRSIFQANEGKDATVACYQGQVVVSGRRDQEPIGWIAMDRSRQGHGVNCSRGLEGGQPNAGLF